MDRTVSPKCSTSTRFDYKTPRKPPLASWEGSPYLPSFFPQLASVWPFLRSFGLEFGRPTQPQMEAQVEHKKHITCVTTLETTWRVEQKPEEKPMENSTAKIILVQKLEEMSFAYHVDISILFQLVWIFSTSDLQQKIKLIFGIIHDSCDVFNR